MSNRLRPRPSRRTFIQTTLAAGAAAAISAGPRRLFGAAAGPQLEAGEGVVDTTPPLKIEMGGFHKPPGQERRIEGIRHRTAARALVLRLGDAQAAVVSLDIAVVSVEVASRIAARVAKEVAIPADAVRICATHTHSMPTFHPLRQWGAVPLEYMATVETAVVEAIKLAKQDLAPAQLHVGTARAPGASFNRTTPKFKTDEQYTAAATDDERWLDTVLHVLRFERTGPVKKPDMLWYHFTAHPVCYTDGQAGPDWPGIVSDMVQKSHGIAPSFLQGHAGDVNPGDGTPWIGDPDKTSTRVYAALKAAIEAAKPVKVDVLNAKTTRGDVAVDRDLLKEQLEQYKKDPAKCASGEWVDAGFAKDWYEAASKWEINAEKITVPVSTLHLGEVGWIFHPSELFSYYGLKVRHSMPTPHTLVVGYTDGIIGYLSDPNGYKAHIYEASVVPKILSMPPFTPTAARSFTEQLIELGKKNLA